MAKKAATADIDVDALLGDAASTDTKKKKSNVPVVKVSNPTVEKAIKKLIKTKEEMSTLEATVKDLTDDIIPEAKKAHADIIEEGMATVPTTIKMQCADGKSISVDVAKNQYSKVAVEEEPELKKIFGDEYESLFKKVMSISLTKAALDDKDILKKLILAVGQENLKKYFDISHVLQPTEKFHQGRFVEGEIKDKAEQVISEGKVKPYKPAIRV